MLLDAANFHYSSLTLVGNRGDRDCVSVERTQNAGALPGNPFQDT